MKMTPMRTAAFVLTLLISGALASARDFTLTILHNNDLHAHIEPTNIRGKLYGGHARMATLVKKYRASDPNVVLLNGGDTFQGTLFFNAYEGLADVSIMNVIGFQAAVVGNHEFDRGPSALGAFARQARFPVLAANLDVSKEPLLKDLIKASTVLKVGNEQIGVVGAVTEDLPSISAMGETVQMKPLVRAIQAEVNALEKRGINKIVLISHCGYSEEQALASKLQGIDVIVGGHSHTLLGDLQIENWPKSAGKYPTVVKDSKGKTTLVVQAWEWSKVLGRIKVIFDDKGYVTSWKDAAPIPVDESIAEDPVIASMIAAFNKPIEAMKNAKIGSSSVMLTRGGGSGESLMGNVIADAMLAATRDQGSVAAFANQGGVRAGIESGTISYGAAIMVQPFGNTLTILELSGAELKAAMEEAVTSGVGGGLLLPSSGTSYVVDLSKPAGSRINEVMVAGSPLELTKTYRLTFNNFTAGGGDAHFVLKSAKGNRIETGKVDIDVLVDFIKTRSPLDYKAEGRIKIIGR